jgi:tyrosine-specific transport protein
MLLLLLLHDAGTYGVLTLFGMLPAAMAWSECYADTTLTKIEIVPGGRPVLLVVGGTAAVIILNEVAETVSRLGAGS